MKADNVIKIKIGDKLVDVSFNETKRLNILITNLVQKKLRQFARIPGIILNIDLSGIHFIDSAGFQTLLYILNTTKKYGAKLKLSNINNDVCELIQLVKLQNTFSDVVHKTQKRCIA